MANPERSQTVEPDPLAILRAAHVFRHLSDAARRSLAATVRVERCPSRTLLVSRTSPPQHLRYVAAGAVEPSLSSPSGREARLPPTRVGEWATWVSCFVDAQWAHDLWSAPGSVFVAFPIPSVRAAVGKNPDALLDVIELIGLRTRALVAWNLASNLASDEQRLARLILHFAPRTDDRSTQAEVTQEHLGQFGFGSRQRVSRLMKNLEARGLIEVRYRRITIGSVDKLRDFIAY
ncbi:MAG: Crp/Fnr family transcriptional regulator [Hyphomicrobiales bacterium]|nr:Crp/Fnr family transcriptional regulator [Hyphomicrobiales bacterium]